MDTRQSRLLFHALDGGGIGHLARQVNLARRLREIDPECDVLFLTESSYGPSIGPEFPFVLLPSNRELAGTGWSTSIAGRARSALHEEIDAILSTYEPGALIHDTAISDGLFARAHAHGIKQAIVLQEWQCFDGRAVQQDIPLLGRCDLIILPYDLERCEGMVERLPAQRPPVASIGNLFRTPESPRADTRSDLGLAASDLFVLVTAGGGGFEEVPDRYEVAFRAIERASSRLPAVQAGLVLGPCYTGPSPVIGRVPTRVWRHDPNVPDLLTAADLVIAEAGYNTVAELRASGARAVLLPAPRELDDQFARAAEAAAVWPHIRALPVPDPDALSVIILDALQQPSLEERRPVAHDIRPEYARDLRLVLALGRAHVGSRLRKQRVQLSGHYI